ncbi:hypothetical protein N657DRAFT_681607 [Parathielavia appendiculata]|uniref:Nicotinamide riboside kinase 1 n=1 Tax=Parathielavia appendiculata TaxID=2587402 RepID=A0AAN6Z3E4_9PEZI|nr:hypothetical protein N657DRAFT_681607 [Parathielavia appendiculata]
MDPPRTIIIGISGCSSSGKTTLARLLRDMFPETFILHEDDFYKPESELPIKNGLVDWDCPEAISIPDLEDALAHIRATGTLPVSNSVPIASPILSLSHRSNHGCVPHPATCPPSPPLFIPLLPSTPSPPLPESPLSSPSPSTSSNPLTNPPTPRGLPPPQPTVDSKEDLNSVGPCPATPSHIAACAALVQNWLSPGQPGSLIFPLSPAPRQQQQQQTQTSSSSSPPPPPPPPPNAKPKIRICLLDGFLLYAPPHFSRVMSLLDVKLFLRVSKTKALQRREARDGYVTLEGFWKDPPGYVEQIVWPNHVEAHRWMFHQGGKVDGGEEGGGGELDWEAVRRAGISVMDGAEDREFGEVLEWAVRVVMEEVERIVLG